MQILGIIFLRATYLSLTVSVTPWVRLLFSELHCFPYVPIITHVWIAAALVWFCTRTRTYPTLKRATPNWLPFEVRFISLSGSPNEDWELYPVWEMWRLRPCKMMAAKGIALLLILHRERMLCRQGLVTQEHFKRCIFPQWLIFYFTLPQLVFSRACISLNFWIIFF